MNPLSATVIGGSLLVSGPAWWATFVDGTLSLDVAVQRWLLCLVAVWAALSLVTRLSERALATTSALRDPEGQQSAMDVVGSSFDTAPNLSMSPNMGTARRFGDESPEPED